MAYTPDLQAENNAPPGLDKTRWNNTQTGISAAATVADNAMALATSVGSSGLIKGVDGRNYRLVSCALRNNGGSTWEVISDSSHRPTGVASVGTTSTGIVLSYDFTATRVSSLQVSTDEALTLRGIEAGASVGLASATIQLHRSVPGIGDYVSYNGSAWTSFGGVFTPIDYGVFGPGILQLSHAPIEPSSRPRGAVTARDASWRVGLGSMSSELTHVQFFNVGAATAAGSAVNTMKVWVERFGQAVSAPLNPADVNISTGNLWVTGLMEV